MQFHACPHLASLYCLNLVNYIATYFRCFFFLPYTYFTINLVSLVHFPQIAEFMYCCCYVSLYFVFIVAWRETISCRLYYRMCYICCKSLHHKPELSRQCIYLSAALVVAYHFTQTYETCFAQILNLNMRLCVCYVNSTSAYWKISYRGKNTATDIRNAEWQRSCL